MKRSCQPITSRKITMRPPASPASPGVACQSLSAAAPFIQSQRAASCRIHSPASAISPSFQPLSPYAASHYLPGALQVAPPPPLLPPPSSSAQPSTLTSSHSASLRCPTPPPLLVLMSHCEIQADGWGTKGREGCPPLPVPPCITANQALGNLLKLSRQSNE